MLANLEGEDEMPPPAPGPNIINVPPPVRLSGSRATSEIPPIASVSVPGSAAAGGKGAAAPPIATADEPFESALGLGELASLTVTNEAEALSYEVGVADTCSSLTGFKGLKPMSSSTTSLSSPEATIPTFWPAPNSNFFCAAYLDS